MVFLWFSYGFPMVFLWFQHSSKQIWVESPWIPRCHHKFLRCPVRIFQAQFHGGYGFSTGESYGNGVGTGMNMCSMLSLLSYIQKMYVYIYIHTRICISATYIYHNICSNTQKDGTVIYHYFSRIFLLLSLWGCYIYIYAHHLYRVRWLCEIPVLDGRFVSIIIYMFIVQIFDEQEVMREGQECADRTKPCKQTTFLTRSFFGQK